MSDERPNPIIDQSARYRAELARREAASTKRAINAYRSIYARLRVQAEALILKAQQENLTTAELRKLAQYRNLLEQTAAELATFQALTRNELDILARAAIVQGERDARGLLSVTATGNLGIAAQFQRIPTGAIETLLGFLDEGGPLYAKLAKMGPHTADVLAQAIIDAVARGYNPRKTADILASAYGTSLTDSLRMMRTVQLWSYREANRATYMANADILDGWIWTAELDADTCMSCVSQHGTLHPLDEPLDDHHNGRCAPVPAVKGYDRVAQPGDGEAWFTSQNEAAQRKQMGPGKYEAWQAGQFQFDALSTKRRDDVYGMMSVETPLNDLIGDS